MNTPTPIWDRVTEKVAGSIFAKRDEIMIDVHTVRLALESHRVHPENVEKSFARVMQVYRVLDSEAAGSRMMEKFGTNLVRFCEARYEEA